MKEIVVYVHGKGGSAQEAEHYKALFPNCEVIGFDCHAQSPWEATEEFSGFFAALRKRCEKLTLVANSIGAFFSLVSLNEKLVDTAYFISPVVDMEQLICNMMRWAGVSEAELAEKMEIPTAFGETLSWKYLCYVREHPISWKIPTHILYGKKDDLTSMETIKAFVEKISAELTVMPDGEHWFHTKEQMQFLDNWIRCIWIPIVAIVVAVTVTVWLGEESIGEAGNAFSITTGIVLILVSMIFRYGAELEQQLHRKIEN